MTGKAPHGMISASVVALGVRKAIPRGVKGWEDTARRRRRCCIPNPKPQRHVGCDRNLWRGRKNLPSSGRKPVAQGGLTGQAIDLLTHIQREREGHGQKRRESVTTFERSVGDVIVTYEKQLLPRVKADAYELIVPAETVGSKPGGGRRYLCRSAIRPRIWRKRSSPSPWTGGAGRLRRTGTVRWTVRRLLRTALPQPARLFTIADLGGWESVSNKLFGAQGCGRRLSNVSKR